MMKRLNMQRFTALALSLLVGLTSVPINNVYAETVNNNHLNGGNASASHLSTSGALGFVKDYAGYRLYIIDENNVRVSPTYDVYNALPDNIAVFYSDTRFDVDGVSPDVHILNHKSILSTYGEDIHISQATIDKMPLPILNNAIGNGDAFREWFMAGKGGTMCSLI